MFRCLHFVVRTSPPIWSWGAVFTSTVLSHTLVCKLTALLSLRVPQVLGLGGCVHCLGVHTGSVYLPLAFLCRLADSGISGSRGSAMSPLLLLGTKLLSYLPDLFEEGHGLVWEAAYVGSRLVCLKWQVLVPLCELVCPRTSPSSCELGGPSVTQRLLSCMCCRYVGLRSHRPVQTTLWVLSVVDLPHPYAALAPSISANAALWFFSIPRHIGIHHEVAQQEYHEL